MPEDKLIKGGQFTLARLLFLLACGVLFAVTMASGKLAIGYLLLNLGLSVLLLFIAFDNRLRLDNTEGGSPLPEQAASRNSDPEITIKDPRARRRSSGRQIKRRR